MSQAGAAGGPPEEEHPGHKVQDLATSALARRRTRRSRRDDGNARSEGQELQGTLNG